MFRNSLIGPRFGWVKWILVGVFTLAWCSTANAQAQPDLTIQIVSVSDTTPQQNQQITVNYRGSNRGNANAGNFTVRFYYSTDSTITTADTYLGAQQAVPFFPAGQTSPTVPIQVRIPLNTPTGAGFIGAIVDYNNQVTESNENNNTSSIAVTVGTNPNTRDLRISFVKLSKTSASPGEQVVVEYRIYNAGGATITQNFATRTYLSNNATITTFDTNLGGGRTNTGIGGGATLPSTTTTYKSTITIPANTQPGDYFISPLTDYNNQVAENDNNNNYLATAIKILSTQADLTVDLVSVSDTTPQQGQTVTLRYRVSNQGKATATNAKVRFYLSTNTTITTFDTYLNVERTHTITGGATLPTATTTFAVQVTVPSNFQPGIRNFGAIIDYDTQITESNENNNTDRIPVFVSGATNTRDLLVSSITLTPNRAQAADQIRVTYQIFNAGRANITTAFKTRIFFSVDGVITTADTSLGGDSSFNGLNARTQSSNITTTVTIPGLRPGNYFIGVIVDFEQKVTENDENNNYIAAPFTLFASTPDLQVNITSLTPAIANPSQNVQVRYRVSNTGGRNAGPFTVRFYYSVDGTITTSDTYLNVQRAFTALNAGASLPSATTTYVATIAVPANATVGARFIGAIVDYDGKVTESNEANNTDAQSINIRAVPTVDLTVSFVKTNITTVAPGGQITFEYRITNSGNSDVTATTFITRFYRSLDQTISIADVSLGGDQTNTAIKAGQTLPTATTTYKVTLTIPANTPAGKYWMGPVVDYSNTVQETNNNNNGLGVQVTVQAPPQPKDDALAVSISVTPITQTPGNDVKVTFVAKNNGTANIVSLGVGVYFSKDITITSADTSLLQTKLFNVAAGTSRTITVTIKLPATLQAGPGFIGLFVDPLANYPEVDETNNTATTPFTVGGTITDADNDGVPSTVDCDDNDKTVFPSYNGRPAAPEICDGKDNNCNSQIDEGIAAVPCYTAATGCTRQANGTYQCSGLCKSGTITCSNGKLSACTGEVKPATEVCDGKDNDCNGLIDDNSVCTEPPTETVAEPPRPDAPTTDAGPEPKPEVGPEPKPESNVDVPPQNCNINGCPTGQICQNDTCIPDPCQGVQCQSDEVCKAGVCTAICGCTQCPSTEKCEDGQCVANPCANSNCQAPESCDPNTGQCVKDDCPLIRCAPGKVCLLGKCIDDPCRNLSCPAGTTCTDGQCVGQNCSEPPTETTTEPGQELIADTPSDASTTQDDAPDTTTTDDAPDTTTTTDDTDGGSGDKVITSDEPETFDGKGSIAGGCCQVSTLSSQGSTAFLILLIMAVLLSFQRKRGTEASR